MFTFPLSPLELFAERRKQFIGWGIPSRVVSRVEACVTDNWADGPGGWTYEWILEADHAKGQENWMLASALYGAARFPCLSTPSRTAALRQQVHCFMRASSRFPLHFEREIVVCKEASGEVSIPVHVYAPQPSSKLPTVILSGGVDTGKMELHRLSKLLCKIGKFRVVAMDMPGTGESNTPLTCDADRIYRAVIEKYRGEGKVGIVGVSFGGHWAAKLALLHQVDAAVNFGGPIGVDGMDADYVAALPNGMPGIVGNAMRLETYPDRQVAGLMIQDFSLKTQGLLDQVDTSPMLAVNGADDQYIPIADVEVFWRYPSAEVWLLRGLTHCAIEKIERVVPGMITWLRKELHGDSMKTRLLHGMAMKVLPEKLSDPRTRTQRYLPS